MSENVAHDVPKGIDAPAVTAWIAERTSITPPLQFAQITGGLSNLTYAATDANGRKLVVRRPPLGHVLATAHDMGREHRIIAALNPTNVPVPPLVGFCEDETVNGAPFYVMDFVDGIIARDIEQGAKLSVAARTASGEDLMRVLHCLHSVDLETVGLADLGRHDGYVERQLKRWQRQWEATKDEDIPEMEQLQNRLSQSIPVQTETTIVHGDYRLDNCILSPSGSVAAVLDWELCTLGDPRADLGLLLVYWEEPTDTLSLGRNGATTLEGFATRDELLSMYAKVSGRNLQDVSYFVALGYWKLACILQGVIVRYRSGSMGDSSGTSQGGNDQVRQLALAGLSALEGRFGHV